MLVFQNFLAVAFFFFCTNFCYIKLLLHPPASVDAPGLEEVLLCSLALAQPTHVCPLLLSPTSCFGRRAVPSREATVFGQFLEVRSSQCSALF